MLNAIRQAALTAMKTAAPVAILLGTVTKIDPLEVNIDQRFTIDADFLLVPESLTRLELNLEHVHSAPGGSTGASLTEPVVIRPGLAPGDRVALLRVQGGQRYFILDKVVSG